jgi:hypothetical protein
MILAMKSHLSIILLAVPVLATAAYRIGDAVGILLRTSSHLHLEAYRHQAPRFGVSTKTKFEISSLTNQDEKEQSTDRWNHREPESVRLSLSFDEGFHHIPWLDVKTKRHTLEKLVITFVYSGSDGSIHAVHREAKYIDGTGSNRKTFLVEYIWIEEADVDLQSGVLVLFMCVVLFVLIGMVGECSASESRQRNDMGKESSFLPSSSEGFTKRL